MGHLGTTSYFPTRDVAWITVAGNAGTAGGGGFVVGASTGPTYVTLYGFNDDVSLVRGNHQMAFGVSSASWWVDSYSAANTEYRATFNGRDYGLGMAGLLPCPGSLWRTG